MSEMVNSSKIILNEVNLSNKVIQIEILQKDRINESLAVLYEGFFPYENVCLGAELTSNPLACDEMAKLGAIISEDGVSVIAVEKDTDKIIGASFNKIQTLSKTNEPGFFKKFRDEHCTQVNSISLMNFETDATVDLSEMFNADCSIEMVFLAVLPEYGKKGIGKELVESSLNYAESLKKNIHDNKPLPQIATATVTSIYSYKIFKKLGFEDIIRKEFSDFIFNGKWKYSDKVDCKVHNKGVTLMVKQLNKQQ